MSIESIATASAAMSQAQAQSAVAIRVMKLAQGQSQHVADLVSATLQDLQATIAATAETAAQSLDTYA